MSRQTWMGLVAGAALCCAWSVLTALLKPQVAHAQVADVEVELPRPGPEEDARSKLRRRDDAVDELLAAVVVDGPVVHKSLYVFTVSLRRSIGCILPRTFDDAVEDGVLLVQEVGAGQVNSVRVNNKGSRPVFIMGGEIMTGSKQDRAAQRDVLVPPHSGWIRIPVYCVEQGRWSATSRQFRTGRSLAAPGLRQRAYAQASQEEIWDEVDRIAGALGVPQSESRAFQEIYHHARVQKEVDAYVAGIPLPRGRDLVGLVAYNGRRPIGADLFGHPELFDALREKVLRSYALAAQEWGDRDGEPSLQEAARYLARAWSDHCDRMELDTPGLGQSFRLRNEAQDTAGSALVYEDAAVHVSLFPDAGSKPGPGPIPVPVPRGLE